MTGDIRLDHDRHSRTGIAEAIYCDGKSAQQILAALNSTTDPMLLTRLSPELRFAVQTELGRKLDFDPISRTAFCRHQPAPPAPAQIAIVTAGAADLPVAREAARTLFFHHRSVTEIGDVGVAGLHRLLDQLDLIRTHAIVIAVAGMEGALFSVLAGLIPAQIIAAPTSVGHGVASGGEVALKSALASCAPGVTVVNIDSGYQAACAALRALHAADRIAGNLRQDGPN